jgi:RNA recognition motif-containing protein
MRTLYVGGLPPEADNEALRSMFAGFGEITYAHVVRRLETGDSRGFGYVTFRSELAAMAARRKLDGRELDGQQLRVAPAA